MPELKCALTHIYSATEPKIFFGCGVLIEGDYVLTCAHVAKNALSGSTKKLKVEFPHVFKEKKLFSSTASIEYSGFNEPENKIDCAILKLHTSPNKQLAPRLQLAMSEHFEVGEAYILTYLPSRGIDDDIHGHINGFINSKNFTKFLAQHDKGYFVESGSSGSPLFIKGGQQIAGILAQAEAPEDQKEGGPKVAMMVPASLIRSAISGKVGNLSNTKTQSAVRRGEFTFNIASASDIGRFAPASGHLSAAQPRQTSISEGHEIRSYEVIGRITFVGRMRAICENVGDVFITYSQAELFISCMNGRVIEPSFSQPLDDTAQRNISALGRTRDGAEAWRIVSRPGEYLRGDIFTSEYGDTPESRIASAQVERDHKPTLRAHLSLTLRVSDIQFAHPDKDLAKNRDIKMVVLTALLKKYRTDLTEVEIETN